MDLGVERLSGKKSYLACNETFFRLLEEIWYGTRLQWKTKGREWKLYRNEHGFI